MGGGGDVGGGEFCIIPTRSFFYLFGGGRMSCRETSAMFNSGECVDGTYLRALFSACASRERKRASGLAWCGGREREGDKLLLSIICIVGVG